MSKGKSKCYGPNDGKQNGRTCLVVARQQAIESFGLETVVTVRHVTDLITVRAIELCSMSAAATRTRVMIISRCRNAPIVTSFPAFNKRAH